MKIASRLVSSCLIASVACNSIGCFQSSSPDSATENDQTATSAQEAALEPWTKALEDSLNQFHPPVVRMGAIHLQDVNDTEDFLSPQDSAELQAALRKSAVRQGVDWSAVYTFLGCEGLGVIGGKQGPESCAGDVAALLNETVRFTFAPYHREKKELCKTDKDPGCEIHQVLRLFGSNPLGKHAIFVAKDPVPPTSVQVLHRPMDGQVPDYPEAPLLKSFFATGGTFPAAAQSTVDQGVFAPEIAANGAPPTWASSGEPVNNLYRVSERKVADMGNARTNEIALAWGNLILSVAGMKALWEGVRVASAAVKAGTGTVLARNVQWLLFSLSAAASIGQPAAHMLGLPQYIATFPKDSPARLNLTAALTVIDLAPLFFAVAGTGVSALINRPAQVAQRAQDAAQAIKAVRDAAELAHRATVLQRIKHYVDKKIFTEEQANVLIAKFDELIELDGLSSEQLAKNADDIIQLIDKEAQQTMAAVVKTANVLPDNPNLLLVQPTRGSEPALLWLDPEAWSAIPEPRQVVTDVVNAFAEGKSPAVNSYKAYLVDNTTDGQGFFVQNQVRNRNLPDKPMDYSWKFVFEPDTKWGIKLTVSLKNLADESLRDYGYEGIMRTVGNIKKYFPHALVKTRAEGSLTQELFVLVQKNDINKLPGLIKNLMTTDHSL